jgi:RNA polymerase sigma-70 factor, ECF subfamily
MEAHADQAARAWHQKLSHLLNSAAGGEKSSLAALLDLYRPYLLATARARLEQRLSAKAGPSDLVQETLTEAIVAWDEVKERPRSPDEMRLWLRNIMFARLKELRRRYYQVQSRSVGREWSLDQSGSNKLLDELAVEQETPRRIFDGKTQAEKLEEALNCLSPAERQIILWRNRDGCRFAEIGKRMDRSDDAARMVWKRALRKLKKQLAILTNER